MDRPDVVVDLPQANGVLLEGVGDEQQPLLQADGTGVGDPLDDEVLGILNGWPSSTSPEAYLAGARISLLKADGKAAQVRWKKPRIADTGYLPNKMT